MCVYVVCACGQERSNEEKSMSRHTYRLSIGRLTGQLRKVMRTLIALYLGVNLKIYKYIYEFLIFNIV